VYNLYTDLGCFLRFCGIEPNPTNKHSSGVRKLVGTNVPGKTIRRQKHSRKKSWTSFSS
jgi:hypothetical protein